MRPVPWLSQFRQGFHQTWKLASGFLYDLWSTFAVVQVGFMGREVKRKSERIENDMFFRPLIFLFPSILRSEST